MAKGKVRDRVTVRGKGRVNGNVICYRVYRSQQSNGFVSSVQYSLANTLVYLTNKA